MKIRVNEWVVRNPYPLVCRGFTQTYEHVHPNTLHRVIFIDASRESITLNVYYDGKYYEEEFWAGNFRRSTSTPILEEKVSSLSAPVFGNLPRESNMIYKIYTEDSHGNRVLVSSLMRRGDEFCAVSAAWGQLHPVNSNELVKAGIAKLERMNDAGGE